MSELSANISRFYHQWHALESSLGEGVQVLDFDYCPREYLTDLEAPFADRKEALDVLGDLQNDLARCDASTLRNKAFLVLKLQSTEAFMRALMGERTSFRRYLSSTIGINPEMVAPNDLESMRAELEDRFSQLGISFSSEGRTAYKEKLVLKDITAFESTLRKMAEEWVSLLQKRIGLTAAPKYRIEVVNEDEYWSNWIDGSSQTGIRLRINTHPRITLMRGSETGYAIHEIGAHALQLLELENAWRAGKIDGAALNFTVHSCEQFQLEGLAQTVALLVAEDGDIPEMLDLELRSRFYHNALINNAQI